MLRAIGKIVGLAGVIFFRAVKKVVLRQLNPEEQQTIVFVPMTVMVKRLVLSVNKTQGAGFALKNCGLVQGKRGRINNGDNDRLD